MKKISTLIFIFLFSQQILLAQLPNPALVGYWQNWSDVNSPYIQLDQVDLRYNVVCLAFAVPQTGTDYRMEWILTSREVLSPLVAEQFLRLLTSQSSG